MYYVYILQSRRDWSLYTGVTSDLKRRVEEHNQGLNGSTKRHVPYRVVYYEAFFAKEDAYKRERQLKRFKQGFTRLKERIQHSLGG